MIDVDFKRTNFYPLRIKSIFSKDLSNFINSKNLINLRINQNFILNEISSIEKIYDNSILFTNKKVDLKENLKIVIVTNNKDFFLERNFYDLIYVHNLDLAYNQILNSLFFHEDDPSFMDEYIAKDHCYISKYSKIGKNVKIGINSIISRGVEIGDNCIIKNNVVVKNAIIGNKVNIGDNTVIGGTGFGFDLAKMGSENIKPHIGIVKIDDNVFIGSNCSIDRGRIHITHIGTNSMLDNQIHLAHNVIIGKNCCIAAQTGIAGSTIVNDNVIIGGQVGITGHIKIGQNVKIAAKSGVTKNINSNSTIAGFPAIDIKEWRKKIIRNMKNGYK